MIPESMKIKMNNNLNTFINLIFMKKRFLLFFGVLFCASAARTQPSDPNLGSFLLQNLSIY